jgi:hypothetical protein
MLTYRVALSAIIALALAAAVAACSGGGGSTVNPPGGGHSPTPSASPALSGALQLVNGGSYPAPTYSNAAAAAVDFSCGCTSVAGSANTDANGNFALVAVSTPVPTPNPPYTIVGGRNYLIVANPTAGSQAWTIQFAGNSPAHDAYLSASNQSDVYTAAVSLYVFEYSPGGSEAFDNWNFNALVAWYGQLKSSPSAPEITLLSDIVTQSKAGAMLWPAVPKWRPGLSPVNATIRTDLTNVHTSAADPLLPTPCPGGACTGTPTP